MAKARRTIRTENEDGSATIDLNAPKPEAPLEDTGKLPDYGSPEAKEAAEKHQSKAHRTERRDDDGPSLEDQIRSLKKAEQAARQRADEERAARTAAEQQRYVDAHRAQQEVERSHYDLVANTLDGQQNALIIAKQEYAAARAMNDPAGETEALDKITKINQKIQTLEDGRQEMQRRIQTPRPIPQVQQPSGPPNVENILAQMPALTNEERDWIREHPDTVTDPRQISRMQVAYQDAEERGIRRNSAEYFRFFEERLGYDHREEEYDDVDNDEAPPQRRSAPRVPAAAPVSRSSPGASTRDAPRSGQVTLTKEEREAARFSGVDERTYAENKRKLIDLKRKGYYTEQG